jgi:hypothetical protein
MHLSKKLLLQAKFTLLAKVPHLLLLLAAPVSGASIEFDAAKHLWSLKSGSDSLHPLQT